MLKSELCKLKAVRCILILSMAATLFGCVKQEPIQIDGEIEGETLQVSEFVPGKKEIAKLDLADGTYDVYVTMEGGSGRASIQNNTTLTVKDGVAMTRITWSSPYYDYMLVDGVKYETANEALGIQGNSIFEIPVTFVDEKMTVIADTTAMSEPHEIEYTLYFDSRSIVGNGRVGGMDSYTDLTFDRVYEMEYATKISITFGDLGYALLSISDEKDTLLVPANMKVPVGVPEDMLVLQLPLEKTYIASTSVMDYIASVDAMDHVAFSGLEKDDWYVEAARDAMEAGDVVYAGKYSAPDMELLVAGGCDLAIENTMIYHSPDIKEQIEGLGIPVLVEKSSYESDPFGRMEWIKLYGVLFDQKDAADACFEQEVKAAQDLVSTEDTKKTVAFFFVNGNGAVNVRKPSDYVPKMIELAGANYIFETMDGEDENALSTMNMQMEAFYESAHDADILIYNSTIDSVIYTMDELLEKSPLFADFEAVKNGQVYCTEKSMFQESMSIGKMITDMNLIFTDENVKDEDLTYMHRVK